MSAVDKIKKNETGGTCSTYGRKDRCIQDFGGNLKEDLRIDGGIILERVFKKWDGGLGWIDLAQDTYRLRAILNAVMNYGFQKCRKFP